MSLSETRDLDIVPIGDNNQKISVVQSHHKSKEKGKEEFFDNLWKATKNVLGIDRKEKHEEPKPEPPPPPPKAPEPKKEEPKKEEPKKEEPKKEEPKPEPPKPILEFPVSEGKRPMESTSGATPEKNETVIPVIPVPEAP